MLLDDRLNWRLLRQEEPEIGADEAAAEVAGETAEGADTEAVEAETAAEPEDSNEQSLSDILRERELGEYAGDDDNATLDRISEQLKAGKQYQQQLAQAQQHLQWQQYQAYQQAQAAQQAQQAAAQQRHTGPQYHGVLSHWQTVPDYNEQWLQFLDQDEHGNPVVKPGGDPTLPQKIAAYKEWQRQGLNTVLSNPTQFVADAIYSNPEISQAFDYMIEQRLAPIRQQMELQRLVEAVKPELCVMEPDGRVKVDASGNTMLTPIGRHYAAYTHRFQQQGIPDHQAHSMALEFARLQAAKEAPAQQATPTEKREARNFRIMRQGAQKTRPHRGVPSASNKRPSGSDLQQEMRQALAAAGVGDADIDL